VIGAQELIAKDEVLSARRQARRRALRYSEYAFIEIHQP
jgi:hypothetical protein